MSQSKVLIIVGMHRSGTSLTASILQKAGLNIGKSLIGKAKGNEFGHFENLEFVKFHELTLAKNNFNTAGYILDDIDVNDSETIILAQDLIKNNEDSQWGWKDPRTVLFLPLWERLLPDANYLFIYRSPWEVVDSLFRRGLDHDELFNEKPSMALSIWNSYNQKIKAHYKNHKNKSIIFNINDIINKPQKLQESLLGLGFDLNIEVSNNFVESHFQSDLELGKICLIQNIFPDVYKTYAQLCKLSYFDTPEIKSTNHLKNIINWWYESRQFKKTLEAFIAKKEELENISLELSKEKEKLERLSLELIKEKETSLYSVNSNHEFQSKILLLSREIDEMKSSRYWKLKMFIAKVFKQ